MDDKKKSDKLSLKMPAWMLRLINALPIDANVADELAGTSKRRRQRTEPKDLDKKKKRKRKIAKASRKRNR